MLRMMIRALRSAAPVLLGAGLVASAHALERDVCRVDAEVIPAHAVVGQQLLYRARITRRASVSKVEWQRSPIFPDFRAERLPGRAEVQEVAADGSVWLTRDELRAIFPARAGELDIPLASISCQIRGEGGDIASTRHVDIAPISVEVREPPQQDRPRGYAGLVGRVHVQLTLSPETVSLGQSIRGSVIVRGAANVWIQPNPFDLSRLEDVSPRVELFLQDGAIDLLRGDRLQARSFHRFVLVPRQTGLISIPALRVSYYDPEMARYATASTEAVEIRVVPAVELTSDDDDKATRGSSDLARDVQAEARSGRDEATPGLLVPLLILLLLAGVGAGLPLLVRRRERGRLLEHALRRAREAAARNDIRAEAAAYEEALRVILEWRAPRLRMLGAAEVEAVADDEVVLRIGAMLRTIEQSRYGEVTAGLDRVEIEKLIRTAVR